MNAECSSDKERIAKVCVDELETWIAAAPEVVWQKAVIEVNAWWRANLREGSLGVFIEPWVGGRFWQKFDADGHGVLYGSVSYILPPRAIHFTNAFGMAGVSIWTNTWRFFPQDEGTLFQYTNQIMAELPQRYMSGNYRTATKGLLASLKHYVEQTG
jgi:hypothetical protein